MTNRGTTARVATSPLVGIVVALMVGLFGLIALAPSAGADPAQPSNYRSTVLRITPPNDAISVRVVGGDGFVDLKAKPGHTVEIPGYTGEPWLRIDADGTVRENQASSATYLNETRFGTAGNIDIPDWVTIKGAKDHPRWKTVARSGHYTWHDHRIHYMNPSIAPETVPGTNRVLISDRDDGLWYIPVTIDGVPTQILGELRVFEAPSPLPQWGLAVALFLALSVIGLMLKGPASRIAAGALVVIGGLAIWAGTSELAAVPSMAGGNPIWVALPVVCVVLALGALVIRSAAARAIAVLAAAAALAVWAVLRVPAFDKAVPLGSLDPALTRAIAAAALGTAAGSMVAAIASGGLALRLADLDDDDEGEGNDLWRDGNDATRGDSDAIERSVSSE